MRVRGQAWVFGAGASPSHGSRRPDSNVVFLIVVAFKSLQALEVVWTDESEKKDTDKCERANEKRVGGPEFLSNLRSLPAFFR